MFQQIIIAFILCKPQKRTVCDASYCAGVDIIFKNLAAENWLYLQKYTQIMAKAVVLILSLSVVVGVAVSHENGAPVVRNVCENLMPSTSSPHLRQSGNGGYAITLPPSLRPSGNGYFSYEAGALYDG